MEHPIGVEAEDKLIAILRVLSESSVPLGSITIARRMAEEGVFLSERAVRYHLKIADERGFTIPGGRDGRMITEEGRREVKEALAPQQMGFVRDKLEMLAYLTTFDPKRRTGLVSVNMSLFETGKFQRALSVMSDVFKAGFCVSPYVGIAREGEKIGSYYVPQGKTGLATVCGATINGVLLKAGVPTEFRFGGVLEVRNRIARRYVALTEYAGTSTDPSEQFIQAGMTSVSQAVSTGNGKILGAFRTIPAPAREEVVEILERLKEAGIGGVHALGNVSEPVCQIPVSPNRVGVVQLGGLNPVAAAVEAGIGTENVAESGMIAFEKLVPFQELLKKVS